MGHPVQPRNRGGRGRGLLKPLDVDQYLEFKSAITQALYRYLHTRSLNRKPHYAENLETLAFERLGLSRSYRWLSDVKRKLDVAHAELRNAGFLADVHDAPMSGAGRSRGDAG